MTKCNTNVIVISRRERRLAMNANLLKLYIFDFLSRNGKQLFVVGAWFLQLLLRYFW